MTSDFVLKGDLHGFTDLPPSVTGWKAELIQTSPGEFHSDVLFFQGGPLQLIHSYFNKELVHTGESPEGRRNFAVQLADNAPYPAYGTIFSGDEIMVMAASRELGSVTAPGISNMNISLPVEVVEELSESRGCSGLLKKLEAGGTFRPSPESLAELKRVLRQVNAHVRHGCGIHDYALIRDDVITALADCFSSVGEISPGSLNSRRRAVRRACEFIRECGGESLSLAQLCGAAEVSERTLLYAFKQCFGVSPKAFVKKYRLRGAFKALLNGEGKSVTKIATDWGFWHMGQFGADYKRMFGELPSATLRRMPVKVQFVVPPQTVFG